MRAVSAVLAALALVAAACGDDGDEGRGEPAPGTAAPTTTSQPKVGGTLTFAAFSAIRGLDPIVALGHGTSGGIQMAAVYDTIVRWNADTRKYENRTADSVTSSADSTEWTVKLKPNVKFHDGTDYDAEAVKFGMSRHRSGLPGAPKCDEIVACPSNTTSSAVYMALIKDIQVVDKLTLKFSLTEPWASFPYALSAEAAMIPSPTALRKCDPTKNPNTCEFNLKAVGAGPFMVESFKAEEAIVLVRNPNYWGGQVYLDSLRFVQFGDAGSTKTLDAFKTGGVQGAYLRVPDSIKAAKDAGIKGISTIEQSGQNMLLNMGVRVNCSGGKPEPLCVGKPDGPTPTNPATKNIKVRQAAAAAIDMKVIDQRVSNGAGLPGTELFQRSFPWDPGVPGPKVDPERAKQLVAEAKAEGWDGTIRLLFTNTPFGQNLGLAVQSMLEAVGMKTVLETPEQVAQQLRVTTAKDFEVTTWGTSIGPDDGAMWALAQNLSSASPSNRVGFSSPKVDQALKDLRAAKTDDQLKAAYKVIAEEVNAQLPWLNQSAAETYSVFSPKVHGVLPGNRAYVFFYQAWMDT
jgi:peptide/nickel transport system substrate-binding protein